MVGDRLLPLKTHRTIGEDSANSNPADSLEV